MMTRKESEGERRDDDFFLSAQVSGLHLAGHYFMRLAHCKFMIKKKCKTENDLELTSRAYFHWSLRWSTSNSTKPPFNPDKLRWKWTFIFSYILSFYCCEFVKDNSDISPALMTELHRTGISLSIPPRKCKKKNQIIQLSEYMIATTKTPKIETFYLNWNMDNIQLWEGEGYISVNISLLGYFMYTELSRSSLPFSFYARMPIFLVRSTRAYIFLYLRLMEEPASSPGRYYSPMGSTITIVAYLIIRSKAVLGWKEDRYLFN